MSLKSLCEKLPKLQQSEEFQIKTALLNTMHSLSIQGYNIGDFQDLVNCIETNNLDPNGLNLPYDYQTLKQDILSGKYESKNRNSNIDIHELERKINNGELPGWTIRE